MKYKSHFKLKRRSSWAGITFIVPSLAGVAVFVFIPFLDVIRRSFLGAVDGRWTGIENYKRIFENSAFKLALGNTLKFVGVCIPLLVILALVVSVLLYRCKSWMGYLKSAFLVPMAIPVASIALIWKLLFNSQGMVNGILDQFGIQAVDFMNSGSSFWVLVGSYIWKNLGYDIVLCLAGLSSIPYNLYEAAKVDGAGNWQCFLKITLPNLLPTLYTITVLSFLNSFKVFREAYLVAGDYPHESMYLMQHLFNNWFRDLELDKLSAAAVVVAVVIFAAMLLLQKAWADKD